MSAVFVYLHVVKRRKLSEANYCFTRLDVLKDPTIAVGQRLGTMVGQHHAVGQMSLPQAKNQAVGHYGWAAPCS